MSRLGTAGIAGLIVLGLCGANPARARDVTFEERVEARRAVERIYHSHRIGALRPFDEAFPRAMIEERVRRDLRLSVALERFWNEQVTAVTLERELERIAGATHFPDRVREIYAALGHDSLLIQESFARATVVERRARERFASDPSIHADRREQAEMLRDRLVRGELDPRSENPARSVEVLERLSILDFERQRANAPRRVGVVGRLDEDDSGFRIRIVLAEDSSEARIATYTVAKRKWDDWWKGVRETLDEASAPTVARALKRLPDPGTRDDRMQALEGACLGSEEWIATLGREGVPIARESHTAVWTGDRMIIWGGLGPLDTGSRYDPVTDSWEPISTVNAPLARFDHTAVWAPDAVDAHGRMIVWGGFNGDALDTGGLYDPVDDRWEPTAQSILALPRARHTAVWTGTEMVIFGGRTAAGSLLATPASYDPATDGWSAVTTANEPSARYDHTAVWAPESGEMIVWGGLGASNVPQNSGGRWNAAGDAWTPTDTAGVDLPAPRHLHTAVWTGDEMIVWGGSNAGGTLYASGGRYDPATDEWTATSDSDAPAARSDHTGVWTGEKMIVWGGSDDVGPLDSGALYDPDPDPANDSWTATAGSVDPYTPAARDNHTAVWSGTEMIVWGGRSSGGLDTGGRYDPLTDGWTETEAGNAPSAREWHTAVWSGAEMIVWGGYNIGPLDTGSRYDPTADVWTPTASLDAPQARYWHTAVWLNGEMIVWGGNPKTNSGGHYDPAADTWTPTVTDGAPDGRYRHSAIATDTEMIVWGGFAGTYSRTGGRYDPTADPADAWTPTATDGAPAARMTHTAVWAPEAVDSDGRMIVWGGSGPGALATGGSYDPVDDGWTPFPNEATPTARYAHTAVWNGSEMIVWGGRSDGEYVNDGGAYDPLTEDWRATTTVGAPPGSGSHTGVWADDRMIVWGGYGTTLLDSGGAYLSGDPADADGDGFACAVDCDDSYAGSYPGADEVCDGRDNDCDTVVDGPDGDGDGIADVCDNCPAAANFEQSDLDTDDEGDRCDLDDGMIYVWFDQPAAVSWQDEQGFDWWNAYKGDLGILRDTGTYSQLSGSNPLAARECGLPMLFLPDVFPPASGEAAFFLTTGTAADVEGGLGFDSSGAPRPNDNPCP